MNNDQELLIELEDRFNNLKEFLERNMELPDEQKRRLRLI